MWGEKLLSAIQERGYSKDWAKRASEGFKELFGASGGRYPVIAEKVVKIRAPEMPESDDGKNVPYAALIHPENPDSGAYGGMSLAIFPATDAPCLLTFVVGTSGLSPDDAVLGRPGHARIEIRPIGQQDSYPCKTYRNIHQRLEPQVIE
jgi:5-methylcytosine-specific restriction protein B